MCVDVFIETVFTEQPPLCVYDKMNHPFVIYMSVSCEPVCGDNFSTMCVFRGAEGKMAEEKTEKVILHVSDL